MKTRISSVALIETASYCVFTFEKYNRVESRRDVLKRIVVLSKKRINFRKLILKKSQEVILGFLFE
jgi:hypothetical protein